MRPDAVTEALLECDGQSAVVHLNDGTRLKVKSREHWLVAPDYLYVVVGRKVHRAAFRNITMIVATVARKSSRAG